MTDNSTEGAGQSFTDTQLWQTLNQCTKPDAHAVVTALEQWLPQIQKVLRSGGSSPTDFTLHDDGHSFRVAKRMFEVIPPETVEGLSPYELAFLVLPAYLHDIGMTPGCRKVSPHYQYLLTGVK